MKVLFHFRFTFRIDALYLRVFYPHEGDDGEPDKGFVDLNIKVFGLRVFVLCRRQGIEAGGLTKSTPKIRTRSSVGKLEQQSDMSTCSSNSKSSFSEWLFFLDCPLRWTIEHH